MKVHGFYYLLGCASLLAAIGFGFLWLAVDPNDAGGGKIVLLNSTLAGANFAAAYLGVRRVKETEDAL